MGNTKGTEINSISKGTKSAPLVQIDKSTGLHLKETFEKAAEEIVNTGDARWVLALMDVDNLKTINDTESHDAGDIIIQTIARQIHSLMDQNKERIKGYRSAPFGDEFYLLIHCREGKKSYAEQHTSKLITKIENTTTTTISVGLTYISDDDTHTEWIERAEKNMKHKKKKGGNGFVWVDKKKSKKKKKTKADDDNNTKSKSKKNDNKPDKKNEAVEDDKKTNPKIKKKKSIFGKTKAGDEEKKNEKSDDADPNDWCAKYNLSGARKKLKKKNWTLSKLYGIKDADKVSQKLRFDFEQKIKFQTAIQCLKERSLILKAKTERKLKANMIHRYDYIELNDKSLLTIPDAEGILSIECFVLIMRKGVVINMNGKGQQNGLGQGASVLGIAKMPALGQPRGGGGGGGYGTNGDAGTVGNGGRTYCNVKLEFKNKSIIPEMLMGSAGGWSYNGDPQGEGGGCIKIVCLEKLVIYENVKLLCNGTDGKGSSGGGSGGSIYLKAPKIKIVNKSKFVMEAIGGKGGPEGGGDGGDGRIRIDCSNDGFDVVNKNIKPAIGYKGKFV